MKIWHLLSNRWNSAITEYALASCRALQQAGHEQKFFCLRNKPAAERAQIYRLNTHPLDSFDLRMLPLLLREFRLDPPDALFAYGGPETVLGSCLKLYKGRNNKLNLIRFRGEPLKNTHSLRKLQYALSLKYCDHVIVPNTQMKQQLADIIDQSPIKRITLGCDETKYYFDENTDLKPDQPTLTVLGRLDPVKGHFFLLGLFAKVLQLWSPEVPRPVLQIIGEPANISGDALKQHAAFLGLQEDRDVQFIFSRIADIRRHLAETSVGIVSSLGSEMICRVAEEFLLCGTRIIVSGVGGLEDVLFENAGHSYRNLSESEIVELLIRELIAGWQETAALKVARSRQANSLYSLNKMSNLLSSVLSC